MIEAILTLVGEIETCYDLVGEVADNAREEACDEVIETTTFPNCNIVSTKFWAFQQINIYKRCHLPYVQTPDIQLRENQIL